MTTTPALARRLLAELLGSAFLAALAAQADVVVTMGCGDACPFIPGKRYVDWELPDPKGRPVDDVRQIRDEIAHRVQDLVEELDRAASPSRSTVGG